MTGNDHLEVSGAENSAADDLADDVKNLLDQLAGQINDADQRHSDGLQNMQARLATLTDRAAVAKSELPDDCAEVFGRVETAMATLSDRLTDAQSHAPPFDPAADAANAALSDEVRAEVRRAIVDGHRDAANAQPMPTFGESGEEPVSPPLRPPLPRFGVSAAEASPAPGPAIERAWLEDRFADIADRVEQSMARLDQHNSFETFGKRFDQLEQRFTAVFDHVSTRGGPDPSALVAVEKQITGLFAQLDRTVTQLGRLDTIESRLSELRDGPSDEQMTRVIRAISPTDAQLSAVAMAAAERVAEHLRGATPESQSGTAVSTTSDPRLAELTALVQEFIGEHRAGDAQTADALDTMQQAMQHLIDRVEAIEAAQIAGHDELMRAARGTPDPRADRHHERLDFGFREQDLVPPGGLGTQELPRLAVIGATAAASPRTSDLDDPHSSPGAPDFDEDARRLAATFDDLNDPPATAAASPPQQSPQQTTAPVADPPHRQAFIAMALRAAEKASREASQARAAADSAGPTRRPRLLLVASIAAFLLAGFWMLSGTDLRGMIPGIGNAQPAPAKSPTRGDASDEMPTHAVSDIAENERGRSSGGPAPNRLPPAPPPPADGGRFPGMGRVVDGGVGITVDEGQRTANPAAMLKAREQIQLASLSARIGQDQAEQAAAGSPEHGGRGGSGQAELPPAMIGPLSLRHAAAKGDARAQFEVAARFAEAKGVPQDFAQAATWYQRAATQGFANAQYRLGALYERGLGVAADPARARVWYGRAAEQGNVRAMHNLAVMSAGSTGVNPNYPSAVQWFTEAASRGLADSQYNLGILYESGLGVPASKVEAYKWYALAARSGDKDAIARRDVLRKTLEPTSVSAADTLVIAWRAKALDPATNDPQNTRK